MKNIRVIIHFILVLAVMGSIVQGLTLSAHGEAASKLGLHGFYPAQMTFSEKTKKYIDALDSVSFAWGRIYGDLEQGVVTELGRNGNTMFYYPADYVEVLRYAKSKNKSIQLNIFSDSDNALKIIPYEEQRGKAVAAIAELLKSDVGSGAGVFFDGIVIDFEGLQNKDIKGKPVSSWYIQFLKELNVQLKTLNKKLYVAVNPSLNYSGYNYKEIAALVDKMIVMAHDYEPVTKLDKSQIMQYTGYNCLSPIDGLAPFKKVKQAMEEVKNKVEKANLSKVLLQINFDAAQWRYAIPSVDSWNKTAGTVMSLETRNTPTYEMIHNRIQNADGRAAKMTYNYNNELQSPVLQFYNVVDQTYNVALYENSKSIAAKINLAREYGLGGISLWSLANVPDYTDKTSKAYGLDVWDSIINSLAARAPLASGTRATFTDKNVEASVRKQLMKPVGSIYSNELAMVYRLNIPAGVKSLADLKKLTNLEYLDINNAQISNISNLGYLKNLRVLYLQRNAISDITPLRGLTKLEVLSLNGNRISSVSSVSALTSLEELYIRDNRITDYSPLVNLKKLNILYLQGNRSVNYAKLSTIKKGLLEKDF